MEFKGSQSVADAVAAAAYLTKTRKRPYDGIENSSVQQPDVKKVSWMCVNCTYANYKPHALTCEMCAAVRV